MNKVLQDFYSSGERRPIHNSEYIAVNDKIKSERQYFESIMTPEDAKRLQALA